MWSPWVSVSLTTILFLWSCRNCSLLPRGLEKSWSPSAGLTSALLRPNAWAGEENSYRGAALQQPWSGTILDGLPSKRKHWRRVETGQNHLPTPDSWHSTTQPLPSTADWRTELAPYGRRRGRLWQELSRRHRNSPDPRSGIHDPPLQAAPMTLLQPPQTTDPSLSTRGGKGTLSKPVLAIMSKSLQSLSHRT